MARRTGGIQAQDQPGWRLSFRARSRSLTAADVERARLEERSLLRTWLMRMTIHVIATDDAHHSTVGARVCLACGAILLTATDPQGLRVAKRDDGQVQEYDF